MFAFACLPSARCVLGVTHSCEQGGWKEGGRPGGATEDGEERRQGEHVLQGKGAGRGVGVGGAGESPLHSCCYCFVLILMEHGQALRSGS